MGGGMGDAVKAVARQCGQLVLRQVPGRVVPRIGGQDDERLTVESRQRRRLLHRAAPLGKPGDQAS